ncbi:YqaA family protein [Lonepinella sp. MS14436]|uniref:YqaA family protein n=1 Tax=Lonepinella sp. MS14436 TaxID=3003619 RepID=UPI0036DA32B7
MFDFLTALLGEHSLYLMFISAFLSATVLPGNSEIVFLALSAKIQIIANHYFSPAIMQLILAATFGNTLGSLTTYWLGRWLPFPEIKPDQQRKVRWILAKFFRYGAILLLFSWLPVLGDLMCAVAGWLRLNVWQTLIYMLIGKGLRYLFLLSMVIGYTFWA